MLSVDFLRGKVDKVEEKKSVGLEANHDCSASLSVSTYHQSPHRDTSQKKRQGRRHNALRGKKKRWAVQRARKSISFHLPFRPCAVLLVQKQALETHREKRE